MSVDFSNPIAQPFLLEGSEDALLLIHGFTGSPSHMRYVGDKVHAAGFTVRGIRLPGHGTSVEDMAQSSGPQWLDACQEAYLEMKRQYRHVSIGGLSMGGILALLLAQAVEPSCVVLFAAAMKYRHWINHLSPVVKYVMPIMHSKGRTEDAATFLYDYDYGYADTPVARVQDMTRLQQAAREGLAKVTCPVLAFQSHRDGSVHPDAPELIMRGVSSQVKEICWVDRSPHVLTIGPDRDYVCDRVIDFLHRYGV